MIAANFKRLPNLEVNVTTDAADYDIVYGFCDSDPDTRPTRNAHSGRLLRIRWSMNV